MNSVRYGIEVMLVSAEPDKLQTETFTIHNKKSLDDEHTPGIFELIEIASPESFIAAKGEWKISLIQSYMF